MSIIPQGAQSPFDQIRHRDESGDYWTGRELQPLMGYAKWENFAKVVRRAEASATNTGQGGFSPIRENLSTKPREDFRLSRFAAYLVAMNGDPNMPQVAAAQAYFAVRTRQAETALPDLSTIDGQLAVAQQLVTQIQARKAAEQQIAELSPKAVSFDNFLSSKDDYAVAVVAQALNRAGATTGRNRLFGQLEQLGWVYKPEGHRQWRLYQRIADQKLAYCRMGKYEDQKTGDVHATYTIRITPKGLARLADHFGVTVTAEHLSGHDVKAVA